jgi:hypothetical protein
MIKLKHLLIIEYLSISTVVVIILLARQSSQQIPVPAIHFKHITRISIEDLTCSAVVGIPTLAYTGITSTSFSALVA